MQSEPLPDSLVISSGLAVSGHQAEVSDLGPLSLWSMQSPRAMSGPVILIQPRAVLISMTYSLSYHLRPCGPPGSGLLPEVMLTQVWEGAHPPRWCGSRKAGPAPWRWWLGSRHNTLGAAELAFHMERGQGSHLTGPQHREGGELALPTTGLSLVDGF